MRSAPWHGGAAKLLCVFAGEASTDRGVRARPPRAWHRRGLLELPVCELVVWPGLRQWRSWWRACACWLLELQVCNLAVWPGLRQGRSWWRALAFCEVMGYPPVPGSSQRERAQGEVRAWVVAHVSGALDTLCSPGAVASPRAPAGALTPKSWIFCGAVRTSLTRTLGFA